METHYTHITSIKIKIKSKFIRKIIHYHKKKLILYSIYILWATSYSYKMLLLTFYVYIYITKKSTATIYIYIT